MTINEIARLADVSISTVSKIMNHKDQNITAGTREKVLQIAKEYNYVPYASARSASVSKTFLLGVLMPDLSQCGKLLGRETGLPRHTLQQPGRCGNRTQTYLRPVQGKGGRCDLGARVHGKSFPTKVF